METEITKIIWIMSIVSTIAGKSNFRVFFLSSIKKTRFITKRSVGINK